MMIFVDILRYLDILGSREEAISQNLKRNSRTCYLLVRFWSPGGSQKRTKREPKGNQREPKRSQREPTGSQKVAKGSHREPTGI